MNRIKFEENMVPGDGNCLFYSIGSALQQNQKFLRMKVSNYILKHKNKKINDLPLKDWISFETGLSVKDYSDKILQNGEWGGHIELYIISNIFKINIFILQKKNEKYKVISTYVYDNNAKNVFLIYDGLHYNYLKVVENRTEIKT